MNATMSAFTQTVTVQKNIQPYRITQAHNMESIRSAGINASGELMATGGDEREITVAYKGAGLFVHTYKLPGVINQLRWHPSQARLLAIATENQVYVLDTETGMKFRMPGAIAATTVAWNHDGQLLAAASSDGLINLWDIATGNLVRTISKDTGTAYASLDWHPTKNILLASGDDIRMIDTAGSTLKIIKHRKEATRVTSVNWHPSGEFFAAADQAGDKSGILSLIRLWDLEGELLITLPGAKSGYQAIAWDKEGNYLASASDALRVWSSTGRLLHTGRSPDQLLGLDWDWVSGEIITSSKRGRIRLWNTEAEMQKEVLYPAKTVRTSHVLSPTRPY